MLSRSIAIIKLMLVITSVNAMAQKSENRSAFEILEDDFSSAFDDLGFIYRDISTFDSYTAIKLGTIGLGTLALVPLDEPLYNYVENNKIKGSTEENIFKVVDQFGTIPVADGLAVGTYITGLIIGDEYIRTTGRLMVETLVLSGFITITSRVIIGRSRPYNRIGNGTFKPFTFDFLYHSFPSGHITISFALATILSNRINRWWASIGLYTIAAMNTAARVYFSEHWASDTFISASVGLLSAIAVIKAYENSIRKSEVDESNINFGISPFGFQFQYRF